jgi:hypothetical protein
VNGFYAYLVALAGYGKWLLAGVPYLAEKIIKQARPEWIAHLDKWISAQLRTRIEIGILLAAIFVAGFLAWQDQHAARIQAEKTAVQITDRRAIKRQLQIFYAEGERFATDGAPDKDIEKFDLSIRSWQVKVIGWLALNMGPGASAKFLDWRPYINDYPQYEGAGLQETWDRNYASYLCRNLDAMIQSNAWDKK